jgi:hypothetical protein
MVNPKKVVRLVSLSVFFSCASLSYAEVPSKVYQQSSTLMVGDPFNLTIDLDNADADDVDLSVLERDFDVLRRGTESNTIMQNGSFERSNKMVLWLSAKVAGDVTLPAIPVGKDQTQARTLSVKPFNMPPASEGGLEIVSSLNPKEAYIQQPLIYRATVLIGVPIAGGQFVDPEVLEGKALIEPIGDQRNYTQRLKGKNVQVAEKVWLITPQQTGPLSIRSGSVEGQLNSGRRFNLATEIYSLDIKPTPAQHTGAWVPAESMTAEQTLSKGPYSSGEPITRTVTLTVTGQSEHALSALSTLPDIPGFKQYADKPVMDQQYNSDSNELVTRLTLKSTLIPQKGGELSVPKLSIPWWNTKTDQAETAVIEAQSLNIAQGAQAQVQETPATSATEQAPSLAVEPPSEEVASNAINSSEPVKSDEVQVTSTQQHIPWWWAALIGAGCLVGGSAITYVVMRKRASNANEAVQETKAPIELSPSRKYVVDACHANDPKALREALLAWGAAVAKQTVTLNVLSEKAEPELARQIQALQAALYKSGGVGFNGDEFKRSFAQSASALEQQLKRREATQDGALSQLNPSFN